MAIDPDAVPHDYVCEKCKPRKVNVEIARRIQAEKSKFLTGKYS
jgi:hypothetical protein